MAVREYFWGVELSDKNKEVVWDPAKEDEEDDELDSSGLTHFLFLKQAVLGAKAKPGERNIIEIEADDFDGNNVKQPLLSLKLGLNESTVLDIGAQPPLTLRLVSGSGPVHLCGQHALEMNEDDMDLLDDEAEESPVKTTLPKAKKRPASTNDEPAKKAKLDDTSESKKKVPQAEDDDDYDSEEDEDFDVDMGDDSDEEGDSDEDEDSDEEDEEDEDDEEEDKKKTPQQKKGNKMNGTGPKKDTKEVSKEKESPKGKEKKTMSVDQVKKLLSQSPAKPKKMMKFTNLVKNTYKINDDKILKELWTWYQDSVLKG